MAQIFRIALLSTLIFANLDSTLAQSPASQVLIDAQIPENCLDKTGRMKPEGVIEQDITGDFPVGGAGV